MCPISLFLSPLNAVDGAAWARRRRMTNQATTAATILAAATPPTTPPAIAPVFELLLDDGELVGDDPEAGVTVGVLAFVVAEAKEAVPVTSGESPISSASVIFQSSIATESASYAHFGTRTPTGTPSGYVPAVAFVVQLYDHSE